MANLVRLSGDRVELPFQALQYSITPPVSKLQAALEGFQALERDGSLHGLPLAERQQVTRYLFQFGHLLFRTLLPGDAFVRLAPAAPLLLEMGQDWSAYPWELLNDGNRWLALAQGVMRYAYPPAAPRPAAAPTSAPEPLRLAGGAAEPLRMLSVSADPLPMGAQSRVARDAARLGTRFLTTLPDLADPADEPPLPVAHRVVEHATLPALEQALAQRPHVLHFSGFAGEEGWFLESERLTSQCAPWDWLLQRLRAAVQQGLRLVVLGDSLGLDSPITALQRTREVLRTGVPAVIRIDGRVGRDRQTEYLRALLRDLAAGIAVETAHGSAVRSLFRSREDAWEWAFLRLYPQGLPREATAAGAAARPDTGLTLLTEPEAPTTDAEPKPEPPEAFATAPAPPTFRGRRRTFDRTAAQRRLVEALLPEKPPASPLVFLTGPAGSGKTQLALALARRVRRRFDHVLYAPARLLPEPPPEALAVPELPPEALAVPELPTGQPAEAPAGHALAAVLAELLGAPGAGREPREALQRICGDGASRLLIVDRWEHREGYDAFCELLHTLPRTCRVLLLSRSQPPLVPGTPVPLEPLTDEELAQVHGAGLAERLGAALDEATATALLARCREDGLLARLLRRAPSLPDAGALAAALHADAAEDAAPAARALPALLVEAAIPRLSPEAVALLPVLALFPWLVHREVLADGADLEGPRLAAGLAELHALGWSDTWDGGRYASLHPRLHGLLAERFCSLGALARLQPRLLRAYRRYLNDTATALGDVPPSWLRYRPPLLAWAEAPGPRPPAEWMRRMHRLGVEAVNLGELAGLLADAEEWRALERLSEHAPALAALPELQGVAGLLARSRYAAGRRLEDPVLQADGLNRLAEPLLEARQVEAATPLLERALELLKGTVGWPVLGRTYRLLSRCYELAGRLDAAEDLLRSAVELAQQLGDSALLAHAGQALARIWARRPGDSEEGERFLERQAQVLRRGGHALETAVLLRSEAELMLHKGQTAAARERLESVLQICREAGDTGEVGRTLLCLADCHIAEDDPEGAFRLVGEAAGSGSELDLEEQGRLLSEICRLFEQRRQLEQALDGYLRIREVLERIGDREALIGVLDHIGGLYFQLGQQAKSTQCYEERLHLQTELTAG